MKKELYNYDIFPMVFLAGEEKKITIKPLGCHAGFIRDNEYTVYVKRVEVAEERRYAGSGGCQTFKIIPDDDGCLRFRCVFPVEGQYFVQIHLNPEEKKLVQLCLYALNSDMKGRYPYRGDLHMHSRRSDGNEDPLVVAANYRGHGYDFMVLSDHRRYYPSLEVRRALKIDNEDNSPLTDYLVVQGEEVHLPLNDAHFVNFGSKYSINALVTPNANQEKDGDNPEWRSFDGKCPDPMTKEEFEAMIKEKAKDIPLENEAERCSLAALRWISEQVRLGGGLGIFPHPYWQCSTMQLSEDFLRVVYKDKPFDAFEVLGGENMFSHNGFQTSFYYEMKAQGYDYPVVGSTDSHGSTVHNRNALICSTIVFAHENKTEDLIDSIKSKYSVAVDTISPEYRLVGDFRLVKYGSFLMENWYPLHDLACQSEGYYLKKYLTNDKTVNSEQILVTLKGQVPALINKYFEL